MAGTRVSDDTAERVLEVLKQEADLEGVSTPSTYYIGEKLGIVHQSVGVAIVKLVNMGKIEILGKVGRGVSVIQILGEEYTR